MVKNLVVSLAVTLPLLAMALTPSLAHAQDTKGTNSAPNAKKPAEMTPVQKLELSANLAKFARTSKEPLQLIVAAQLLQAAGAKYEARPPKEAPDGDLGPEKADSVASLLDEAKAMAKDDKYILSAADDVKAAASKGRVGGGIISLGQITANTIHSRDMTFQGGRFAEIALAGVDTSDFKLEVFDQNGNLICHDTDPAYCSFNPIWTGPFVVKVHNDSGSLAHYRLETN